FLGLSAGILAHHSPVGIEYFDGGFALRLVFQEVVDERAIRRIQSRQNGLGRPFPKAEALIPGCRTWRVEVHVFLRYAVLILPQRSNIVENPECTAVGCQN